MARTYRLRHLPPLGGRHFIDARACRLYMRSFGVAATALRQAGLSDIQVAQRLGWRAQEVHSPACGTFFHPWARKFRPGGAAATTFKRLSSRWARRATRMAMRPGMDADAPAGRVDREYWRPSDLY